MNSYSIIITSLNGVSLPRVDRRRTKKSWYEYCKCMRILMFKFVDNEFYHADHLASISITKKVVNPLAVEVVQHLAESKCDSVLFYWLEACVLNYKKRYINFTATRFFITYSKLSDNYSLTLC